MLTTLRSARNSASETGPRMRRYLHHLLEHPVSRVPDQSDLLRSLLEHCDELTPLHVYTMRQLMGGAADAGYPAMPDRVRFEFPRDHRVQPDAQCGWHFLVGSLWDAEGNECGIEMMLFGIAMYPEPFAKELGPVPDRQPGARAARDRRARRTGDRPDPEPGARRVQHGVRRRTPGRPERHHRSLERAPVDDRGLRHPRRRVSVT